PSQARRRRWFCAPGTGGVQHASAARGVPLRSGAVLSREGNERRQRAVLRGRAGAEAARARHPVHGGFRLHGGTAGGILDRGELRTRPAQKDRGFAACNWLALNRAIPEGSRDLAWSNLFFYVKPACAMLPSFAARPVGFAPPDGYRLQNP